MSKEISSNNVESYLQLRVRPGYDGRDGEVAVETKFPTAINSSTNKWLVARGFSNNKKYNRIKVAIKKRAETLQIYIDDYPITAFEKLVPTAQQFNALSFSSTNTGEHDKFYITNIKITKID